MPMSRKGTNVYCPLGKINIEAVPSQGYWSGGGQFLCWRNKGGKKSEGETGGTHFYKRGGLRPFKVRILYHDVSEQCTCDPNNQEFGISQLCSHLPRKAFSSLTMAFS